MVTASHNPPADNGYKVYLGDGAQIVPPADAGDRGGDRRRSARWRGAAADPGEPADQPARRRGRPTPTWTRSCAHRRPRRAGAAWLRSSTRRCTGSAGGLALRAFEQAGFAAPDVVAAQAEPDPDFPTVAFPNPEEPGAMDLALALAERIGADLVLANDPDGDRLAVAVPDRAAPAAGGR